MNQNLDYTLRALGPGDVASFRQARQWAGRRRVYVHHRFDLSPGKKHIGVFVGAELVSVVTIEIDGDDHLMSITSPPRAGREIVTAATYSIGWQLFSHAGARCIYTMSPTIKGRVHRGSRLVCERCGLTPTGYTEQDEHGIAWARYELTRENWLRHHARKAA